MLDEIGDVSNVAEYMEGVKQRKYRLMGFGHRVYRNMDPRASIMRETCYEVLKELGLEDSPKFKLAMELEQIALKDPFFVERKLYPKRRFLLRHRLVRVRYSDRNVYRYLCVVPQRRLDFTLA